VVQAENDGQFNICRMTCQLITAAPAEVEVELNTE